MGADAGEFGVVVQVHMPVHEPLGLVIFQQAVERLKPHVGLVAAVVQAFGRGVGQQQVDAARPVGLEPEFPGTASHLFSVYW